MFILFYIVRVFVLFFTIIIIIIIIIIIKRYICGTLFCHLPFTHAIAIIHFIRDDLLQEWILFLWILSIIDWVKLEGLYVKFVSDSPEFQQK